MKNIIRNENLGEPKGIELDDVERTINYLQGKVLTVLDACIVDRNQLKAIKDIIKSYFSDAHMQLLQFGYPDIDMLKEIEVETTGVSDERIVGELPSSKEYSDGFLEGFIKNHECGKDIGACSKCHETTLA